LPGLPDSLLKHYISLFLSHTDVLAGWTPKVIEAPLAIWSGRETRVESSEWQSYTTGGFSESFIDGAHYEMMNSPLVDSLAAQLTEFLERTHNSPVKNERILVPV
jgi:thioesterase domain-containing protein